MRTPSTTPNKEHRTFRVEPELWNEFREVCKKNKVSSGEILRTCMQHYINVNKDTSKVKEIQEAFEHENVDVIDPMDIPVQLRKVELV